VNKLNKTEAMCLVMQEYQSAADKFPEFHSAHEGVSVLREEFDELWHEVKIKQGNRDIGKLRAEAIQTAAMALRFLIEICNDEKGQK